MMKTGASESKEQVLMVNLNTDYLHSSKNKEVMQIIKENGRTQIIDKPTRITKDIATLIDIIATTHVQNVSHYMTHPNSLSDHDLVGVIIKKNCKKFASRTMYKRDYAKYEQFSYRKDLQKQPRENGEKEKC